MIFLILLVSIYLYIYNPIFSFISIPSGLIITFISIIITAMNPYIREFIVSSFKKNIYLLSILILALTLNLNITTYWNIYDYVYVQRIINTFVYIFMGLFFSCVIFIYIKKYKNDLNILDFFFKLIIIITTFQAFTVILEFISPEIKEIFRTIIVATGNIDTNHPFRFRGLHGSGGMVLSSTFGLAILFSLYYIISTKNSFLKLTGYSIAILILSIGIFLSSRTGLLIMIIALLSILFYFPKKSLLFLIFISIIGVLFYYSASVFLFDYITYFNEKVFNYAFELFINFNEKGSLETKSSEDLLTMLFLPDFIHLILGSGSGNESVNGVSRSDSGYIQTILYGGIFNFILIYSFIFIVFYKIILIYRNSRKMIFLLVTIFFIMLFLEIKGPIFFQNDISRFFWIIFGISCFEYYNRKNQIKKIKLNKGVLVEKN